MMGYKTPNIDRIAKVGAFFTDTYAQQSCKAGRASFSRREGNYQGRRHAGIVGGALAGHHRALLITTSSRQP